MMRAMALALVAATLQANPDGKGWLRVEGWESFVNQEWQARSQPIVRWDRATDSYQFLGQGDQVESTFYRSAKAEFAYPISDAFSLRGAWRGAKETMTLENRIYGEKSYVEKVRTKGSGGPELGLVLHSGALMNGAFRPGAEQNPDGWAFWPSFSVSAGYGQGWNDFEEPFTHRIHTPVLFAADWPLASWLTFFAAYERVEGRLVEGRTGPLWLRPFPTIEENWEGGYRVYWGQHKPGPWQPRVGPSGSWRLTLLYGGSATSNYTGSRIGRIELLRALPAGLAFSLGYQVREDINFRPSVGVTKQVLEQNLGLGLRWAWSLMPVPAAEAAPEPAL